MAGKSRPKNYHKSTNWVLYIEGIERVRYTSVSIPDEMVADIIVRESAETFPHRVPGEYQPVDVEVIGPSFTDPTVRDLWNKTINVRQGGGATGEDLYFDADVVELDRDKVTEMNKYRLHRCYCAGRKLGTRDANTDEVVQVGFILRPQYIEQIPVT